MPSFVLNVGVLFGLVALAALRWHRLSNFVLNAVLLSELTTKNEIFPLPLIFFLIIERDQQGQGSSR